MALLFAFFILFKPAFPLFDYAINYQYIKAELCENRDNVVIGCDGKCYLVKQLAKSSESEKPLSEKKHAVSEHSDLFCEVWVVSVPVLPGFESARPTWARANHYAFLQSLGFFHPPSRTA